MHKNRTWSIYDASELTPEELSEKLTQHTWTTCTAFQRGPVLYLNDSTSEDGAFECAMVRVDEQTADSFIGRQFESVTFGWCTPEKAENYIKEYDDPFLVSELLVLYSADVSGRLHAPGDYCPACA